MSNYSPFLRTIISVFIFFVWGCQARVEPVAPHLLKGAISTGYLLTRLKSRVEQIQNLKSFIRTTFQGKKLRQSFRQTLLIENDKSVRVDTFGLFGQSLGVFTHHKNRTMFFDPAKGRYYSGLEVDFLMKKMLGTRLDFREHLRIFIGYIPRLEFLKVLDSRLNYDRTQYVLQFTDIQRRGKVTIIFSAMTLLPLEMTRKLGDRLLYSVKWQDYFKIGDYDFPHLVALSFPEKQETIRVSFEKPVINQGLPTDVFQLMEPASSLKIQ